MNIREIAQEWIAALGSAEAALEHALARLHSVDHAFNTRFLGKVSAGLVREPPESLLPMKVTKDGPPVITEFAKGTESPS